MADYVPITDVMNQDHSSRVTDNAQPRYEVGLAPLNIVFSRGSYIRDITITNRGWDKLTLTKIVVIGPWTLLSKFDNVIYPGNTVTIQVQYSPTGQDEDDRGGVFIDCGTAVGPKLVTLSGAGADEEVPTIGPRTTFKMRRGMNTDQWVIWTPSSQWGDPTKIIPFPEWRQHVTHAQMFEVRNSGIDFIRMPVDPSVFLSPMTAEIRSQIYDAVEDSIRFLQSAGFDVIVDLHLIGGSDPMAPKMTDVFTDDGMFERYLQVLAEMARRVKKFSATDVALEFMNEPTAGGQADWVQKFTGMQKRMHSTVRAIIPDHTLVLTMADGNFSHIGPINPNDYNDKNILWTFHSYLPFLVSHQGASWAGDVVNHVKNIPYPIWSVSPEEFDARLKEIYADVRATANPDRVDGIIWYIDNELHAIDTPAKMDAVVNEPFEAMRLWARRYGIPKENIYLGEFGIIRQEYNKPYIVDPDQRAAYYRDIITRAEFYGFPWSLWSFGGAFGVVEEFEYRKSEPNTMAMIKKLHPIQI